MQFGILKAFSYCLRGNSICAWTVAQYTGMSLIMEDAQQNAEVVEMLVPNIHASKRTVSQSDATNVVIISIMKNAFWLIIAQDNATNIIGVISAQKVTSLPKEFLMIVLLLFVSPVKLNTTQQEDVMSNAYGQRKLCLNTGYW